MVSVTTLAFPDDSTNNYIFASEDGVIYTGQRHGNKKVRKRLVDLSF